LEWQHELEAEVNGRESEWKDTETIVFEHMGMKSGGWAHHDPAMPSISESNA